MNLTTDKPIMIFKKEFDGKTNYSMGMSKKKQDGTYDNGYMKVQFKKGNEPTGEQTKIYIKDAWLSFNLFEKKTYPYVFINEYTTIEDAILESKVEKEVNDPFSDYGDMLEVNDNFLD